MEQIKLDYKILGQGKSVILFENGLGGHYHDWRLVIDAIKTEVTAVTYHRGGYGESVSPFPSRNTAQIAEELHSLMEELGILDKIILVGHSFGGLCVQHFARLYPQKVRGVILLDSTSADFMELYSLDLPVLFGHIAIEKLVAKWNELSKKRTNELRSIMGSGLSEEQLKLPSMLHEELAAFGANPTTYKTMAAEAENWGLSSVKMKEAPDFPDIPLITIARDMDVSIKFYTDRGIPEAEAVAYENTWRRLQMEHSLLSKHGKLVVAEDSDHIIQLEKPEVVIASIREIMGYTTLE